MHLSMLLDMAAAGFGDRTAVGPIGDGLTYAQLALESQRVATWVTAQNVKRVGYVDVNSDAFPTLLYGSALAGLPFVPINYRLADEQLRSILSRTGPAIVVADDAVIERVGPVDGVELMTRTALSKELSQVEPAAPDVSGDPDDIAVLLFTSGTTGEPKAAVLRHRHLASYVIATVEFMGAAEDEATLVSVPPYHIAGISAALTSVYSGRRIVYLASFSPETWVATARDEAITHAMVVPTMLGRILDVLEQEGEQLKHLRHLSYGGGRMPVPVIERALRLLPHAAFVNAYGLTETSSTISILGPDDHREASQSDDPAVRARLGSVGRPLPTLEVEIRDGEGGLVIPGEVGELWVRGEQVAGEYLDRPEVVDAGWFPTRDSCYLDDAGYLYLAGRIDDVIVRGAENMSPGEIEEVLAAHPAVEDAAVVGVPDSEWGEKVVAAVVLATGATTNEDELREWVRGKLRSSKTPAHISFYESLPHNEMGKLLRRVLRDELAARYAVNQEM
jgi:acyl-CoA synthetase (AMP-forming)/AMP-acid ligase II